MMANNEIGTVEPIAEIGAVCKAHKVLFHTDAVQAVGHLPIDVKAMNIDLLSLSGHKFYAPKGTGALYIRTGVRLQNLIEGGAQERSRRAGTENLPAIVGMGAAIELITAEMPEETPRMTALRDKLIRGILDAIPESRLNGHPTQRLPGNCQHLGALYRGRIPAAARWIWRASPHRPAPPAPPVRSIRRMCCWPSACRMKLRTVRCASRWAAKPRKSRSTMCWSSCPRSSSVCAPCRRCTPTATSNKRHNAKEIDNMYSEKVMDHFTNPRNVGEIEDASGVGTVGNAKCGDIMRIFLKIEDGIITDVKFKTFGCGAAIATSSMATEMVKGKTIEEALKLTNKAVAEALDGLPPVKMHCSLLAEQALKEALEDYFTKNNLPLPEGFTKPDAEHEEA